MKTTTQYLIHCDYRDNGNTRSAPILVVPEETIAKEICGEMETNPGSPYLIQALIIMGESSLPNDAGFGYDKIPVLEEIPLLTKDELIHKLQAGAKMEDLFDFRPGQECDIFKTAHFIPGDKIIYIPDLSLNKIPTGRPVSGPEEITDILHSCYTGDEFLVECDGNAEKAESLFSYCDWQHPSSALPEIDDDENE